MTAPTFAHVSGPALNLWQLGHGYQLKHGRLPTVRELAAMAGYSLAKVHSMKNELRGAGLLTPGRPFGSGSTARTAAFLPATATADERAA